MSYEWSSGVLVSSKEIGPAPVKPSYTVDSISSDDDWASIKGTQKSTPSSHSFGSGFNIGFNTGMNTLRSAPPSTLQKRISFRTVEGSSRPSRLNSSPPEPLTKLCSKDTPPTVTATLKEFQSVIHTRREDTFDSSLISDFNSLNLSSGIGQEIQHSSGFDTADFPVLTSHYHVPDSIDSRMSHRPRRRKESKRRSVRSGSRTNKGSSRRIVSLERMRRDSVYKHAEVETAEIQKAAFQLGPKVSSKQRMICGHAKWMSVEKVADVLFVNENAIEDVLKILTSKHVGSAQVMGDYYSPVKRVEIIHDGCLSIELARIRRTYGYVKENRIELAFQKSEESKIFKVCNYICEENSRVRSPGEIAELIHLESGNLYVRKDGDFTDHDWLLTSFRKIMRNIHSKTITMRSLIYVKLDFMSSDAVILQTSVPQVDIMISELWDKLMDTHGTVSFEYEPDLIRIGKSLMPNFENEYQCRLPSMKETFAFGFPRMQAKIRRAMTII